MAVNYWTAAVLGAVLSPSMQFRFGAIEWGLSLSGGVVFVLGFLTIMISIQKKGLAIPVTLMRLSVIFPVLFSILLWGEAMSPLQLTAFILTLMTIGAFSIRDTLPLTVVHIKENWLNIFFLVVVLGTADTITRALEIYGEPQLFTSYLMILFFTAACLTTLLSIKEISKVNMKIIIAGVLLGIPNYFTSHFILKSLQEFDAVIVFPVFNLAIILISAFIGMVLLKEKLHRYEKIGIALAIPAVILLNL
ncbi:MAG: hypothetical protein Kow00108_05930 [Calditrichia bacterium]